MRFEIIISLSEFNPNLLNLDMLTPEKKKYTKDDYQALDEGAPFQLINADLIMSPSPVVSHQKILLALAKQFMNYMDQNNDPGVLLIAPMDVHLDEENIFQPDLLYVKEDRKKELVREYIFGAPDLIVEILSPSTAYYDLRQKKDIYEKYGVKEYIIIDPIQRNAEIYNLENDRFVLNQKVSSPGKFHLLTLSGLRIDIEKLIS